ncbi:hypothetical protein PVW48_09275 [Dinoroseobacter sp. PD6]|uniref:hypothetical protein n=1 Tax=Dinoroseobacter sp. PD6 TaxID=3028384 RepID=UPI00237A1756|nr:hypothetical protein [Dinoroseobacter sp. PD6]MDD9716934.1 hypothetical protein [Dinoroseobacter sp. PD6]
MTGARQVDVDIAVFAGRFDSQPLVFAHLLDVAPDLDLGHVEVLQDRGIRRRLEGFFPPQTVTRLLVALDEDDTLVLVLPEAGFFEGSARLSALGPARGRVLRA